MVKKYRELPAEIEAIQFTGEDNANLIHVYNFLEGANAESQAEVKPYGKNFEVDYCNGTGRVGDLMIKTFGCEMRVRHGDYIIKTENGKFYPCRPKIFNEKYELLK